MYRGLNIRLRKFGHSLLTYDAQVTKRARCNLRTTQALISLRIRAGWSGPSLPANRINEYCSICRRTENAHINLHGCACLSGPALITACFPWCASNGIMPFSRVTHHTFINAQRMGTYQRCYCLLTIRDSIRNVYAVHSYFLLIVFDDIFFSEECYMTKKKKKKKKKKNTKKFHCLNNAWKSK